MSLLDVLLPANPPEPKGARKIILIGADYADEVAMIGPAPKETREQRTIRVNKYNARRREARMRDRAK